MISLGRFLIYLSTKPHWFCDLSVDENGIGPFLSFWRLKIVRYPYADTARGLAQLGRDKCA